MQAPLFARYKVDERQFWDEANGLAAFYKARGAANTSKDTLYLNHILTYVKSNIFKGLTNKVLYDLGSEIEFYPGLPEFFAETKREINESAELRKYGITLEHYVVSTGLRKMIEGSKIAAYVNGIWACEFAEGTAQPGYLKPTQPKLFDQPVMACITDIAYAIDNTTKTRALFEINKGCNLVQEIDVNSTLEASDRRVPFENMIYIADGPSDVPAFSIMNKHHGHTFAVYKPKMLEQFSQVKKLQADKRVEGIGEADYTNGSFTTMWIRKTIQQIANEITGIQQKALREKVGSSPSHILSDLSSSDPKTISSRPSAPRKRSHKKKVSATPVSIEPKAVQAIISDLQNGSSGMSVLQRKENLKTGS